MNPSKRKNQTTDENSHAAKITKNEDDSSLVAHDNDSVNNDANITTPNKLENNNTVTKLNFDLDHFRKSLIKQAGDTTALTQFIQVCTNPDADHDYLLAYLKSGGSALEILRQARAEDAKNLALATPVFHILQLVIMKVQSSLPHMIATTEESCRYFLNSFIPTVEIMMSEHSSLKHRKVILKLLTAMVTLSPNLGLSILSQVPLTSKSLEFIMEKANYAEKDNIRVCYVQFVTSFMIEDHDPLIKAFLERQSLLQLVFSKLAFDDGKIVVMFLSVIKNNVLSKPNISKSLKLKVFNQNVLCFIFKLFNWIGPSNYRGVYDKEAVKERIVKLSYSMLSTLFTCSKLGLYFQDKYLGTSGIPKNNCLLKALQGLKRLWDIEIEGKLVLEIVKACPDLYPTVINVVERYLTPANSPIWKNTVNYTVKLLQQLEPQKMISKMESMNPVQITNFIRFTTLPIPILKHVTPPLNENDFSISHECIRIIKHMMLSLKSYLKILSSNESPHVYDLVKSRLNVFIPKHIPTSETLLKLVKKVVESETDEFNSEFKNIFLVDILELLTLFCYIQPSLMETVMGSYNIVNLLKYADSQVDSDVTMLKFKTIILLLQLEKLSFSPEKPQFSEMLSNLFDVYISGDAIIASEAHNVLYDILKSTSIFENDEEEIELLLYILRDLKTQELSQVMVEIIDEVMDNLQLYNKQIENDTPKDEFLNCVTIDKLFESIAKSSSVLPDPNVFMRPYTITPFIYGCVKYKSKKNLKAKFKEFVNVFCINILHYKTSPYLLSMVLQSSKFKVKSYVCKWITEVQLLDEDLYMKDSLLNKLSNYLINDKFNIETVFSLKPLSDFSEINSEHIRYFEINDQKYGTILDETRSYELVMCANFIIFYVLRKAHFNTLEITDINKSKTALLVSFNMLNIFERYDLCKTTLNRILKNTAVQEQFMSKQYEQSGSFNNFTEFFISFVEWLKSNSGSSPRWIKLLKPYKSKLYFEMMDQLKKEIDLKRNFNSVQLFTLIDLLGIDEENISPCLQTIIALAIPNFLGENYDAKLPVAIITKILESSQHWSSKTLSDNLVKNIFKLYFLLLESVQWKVKLNDLEECLLEYLNQHLHQSRYINDKMFEKFFKIQSMNKTTSKLGALILSYNAGLCHIFKKHIKIDEVLAQREIIFSFGESLCHHKSFLMDNQEMLKIIYNKYESNIFRALEKPHKIGIMVSSNWRFVYVLILRCMPIATCEKFLSKVYNYEAAEEFHIHLIHAVFLNLVVLHKISKIDCILNYFSNLLSISNLILRQEEIDKNRVMPKLINILKESAIFCHNKRLVNNHDVKGKSKKLYESSIWKTFYKLVLKSSIKVNNIDDNEGVGPDLLGLLTTLIKLLYPSKHSDISILFDMAVSHSEFLDVMLSYYSMEIKSRLLEFLYALMNHDENVMKGQHIPVYLSAYHATRSPSDRLILTILHFYESHGQPMHDYRPYIWGDSAANYYSVQKKRISSLWGHPTPYQMLRLLDEVKITKTISNFPVHQKFTFNYELPEKTFEGCNYLSDNISISTVIDRFIEDNILPLHSDDASNTEEDTEIIINREISNVKLNTLMKLMRENDYAKTSFSATSSDNESIYDPAFLLCILSQMLAPGLSMPCTPLLHSGLLGVPLMALASACPHMRAAAYHVLHRYYLQLEGERMHKNNTILMMDFINTLKNSLYTAIKPTKTDEDAMTALRIPQLPAICAMYLAQSILAIISPSNPLYKSINNFLIAKEKIDFTMVPDFLALFHDSEVETVSRRLWIIEVMKNGTKTLHDAAVIFKTMSVKMILDMYSTTFTDRKMKYNILQLLSSLLSIPRASEILINSYAILSWLNCAFRNFSFNDKNLVSVAITIVNNIWYSLAINMFQTNLVQLKFSDDKDLLYNLAPVKLNNGIERQLILLLLRLLPNLYELEIQDVTNYLRILRKFSIPSLKLLEEEHILELLKICEIHIEPKLNFILQKVAENHSAELLQGYERHCAKSPLSESLKEIFDNYFSMN